MKTMILRMMMMEKDDFEEEDGDGREGGNKQCTIGKKYI